jgi:hypothetical protein
MWRKQTATLREGRFADCWLCEGQETRGAWPRHSTPSEYDGTPLMERIFEASLNRLPTSREQEAETRRLGL